MLVPRTNLMIFFDFYWFLHIFLLFIDFFKCSFPFPSIALRGSFFTLPPSFSIVCKAGFAQDSAGMQLTPWHMYVLRIRNTYTYTYTFEIGFSENTPAECLLQRPIPRGGLAVGKPSIERASPKKEKTQCSQWTLRFLLSLKQYVILYVYVVLTYFMCTFPKRTQKFCDLLLNRNFHARNLPQICLCWKET